MKDTEKEIEKIFGNKVRTRVCGICFRNDEILLVKHQPLGPKGILWAPPGGGINYGESVKECLTREMYEETGLHVSVDHFMFINEFISPPLHAIELFFKVSIVSGALNHGSDPEMSPDKQIIRAVDFKPLKEIAQMDREILHNLFNFATTKEEILNLNGYLNLEK